MMSWGRRAALSAQYTASMLIRPYAYRFWETRHPSDGEAIDKA